MNILAIGAHPDDTDDIESYTGGAGDTDGTGDTDDIEFYTDDIKLGCGGSVLKAVEQGHNVLYIL